MINYEDLGLEELKKMIVEDSGGAISVDDLSNKRKKTLIGVHQALSGIPDVVNLDNAELDEEPNSQEAVVTEVSNKATIPSYNSVEWTDFVMKHFTENELSDGNPTVAGLRRVVGLLLGEIIDSGPVQVFPGNDDNGPGRASVVYSIQIAWTLGLPEYINGDIPVKTFRAVGGSWHGNTDDEFAVYPEAIAETRAEGRALRRALRISKVTADEITKKDVKEILQQTIEHKGRVVEWNPDDLITDAQITIITKVCERLQINVNKFINSGSQQYNDIKEVKREIAVKMIQRLTEYQNNSFEIPATLKEVKNESTVQE